MPLGQSIPPRRGYLPSVTTGTYVGYIGPLNLDFLYVADSDHQVTGLRVNSYTITYTDGGVTHKYTPAYVVTRGKRKCLVDCVPSARLASRIMQRRIAASHEWCDEQGYDFEIITEKDIPSGHHMANIKHLHRYIQHMVEPKFQARVYGILANAPEGLTIQELSEKLASKTVDIHHVIDSICSMACRKAISLDIEQAPLGLGTRVFISYN